MNAPRETDRPKASSLRPLRALLPFLAPYRGRMLIALVALMFAAAAMLALPQALKNVIDKGFTAANAAAIDRYFLLLLVAAAVFAAFASLRMYLVNWIGERLVGDGDRHWERGESGGRVFPAAATAKGLDEPGARPGWLRPIPHSTVTEDNLCR